MDASQAISIRNRIIGILVKRARLNAGKSQRECAEFLGCSSFTFRQYEQGKKGMALPQLEALAYYFDLPVASLWDERQPEVAEQPAESLPVEQMMVLRRKMLAVQFRQWRQASGLTQGEWGEILGCSANIVSQYERGKRDIPFAELEAAAEQSGASVGDLFDEQSIPMSPLAQERQALTRLNELPPDLRDFVLNPTNALYLRVAMLLSALKADSLRQIAETILDITY